MKLTKNSIECRHCGHILISTYGHHFSTHTCEQMVERALRDGDYCGKDAFIATDGGLGYQRIVGNPLDWINRSEYA